MAEATDRTRREVRLRWVALLVFGVGFGYVEAAVVHYLRRIIGFESGYEVGSATVHLDLGFIAFVSPQRAVLVDPGLVGVETSREAATLVMLAAVAAVAGGPLRRRVAAFFIAFAVWDLTYYLFLRVLDGWPTSLATLDVYFLIPVTWMGPVATPVIASSVVLVVASWAFLSDRRARRTDRPSRHRRGSGPL
ncbi:MAG TPA: hypothetical protein VFW79_09325 [Cellulomonas sp.]|uniref:hypothetical protein n=1 Tax=Cellulomonas sp. TaxID=40001 RepID=UPI002E344D0E|nr:hypothetical protein [Cellulomonas sp.]HEX5332834.1 hypothetical protein [Cellulomonas sp.]